MDISGMKEVLQAFYAAQGVQEKETTGNVSRNKGVSFATYMKNAQKKEGTVFPEGEDVVMSHPPLYATKYEVDMTKPREEMTLDEYKQYLCNRISSLPVSTGMKVCGSGTLILREGAFESMKENPAYEEAVIGMLGKTYAQEVSSYMPKVSYQVIGASMEECYGSEIPVKNYGLMMGLTGLTTASGLTGFGSSLTGLTGLNAYGSGLAGWNSLLGLSGTNSSLAGLGSSLPGLSGLGMLNTGLIGNASAYSALSGTNYLNMVNAYQKTAANKNGNTSIREYKSRWREKV